MLKNPFFSQCGQDQFVDNYFSGKTGLFFVDVGANNGWKFSNTAFLELARGWTGLCIEPDPKNFANLVKTRDAACLQCAVSDFDGTADFLCMSGQGATLSRLAQEEPGRYKAIEEGYLTAGCTFSPMVITVRKLQTVFNELHIDHVDYLSMDVEGQELRALKGIDFVQTGIKLLSVENVSHLDFAGFLKPFGYTLIEQMQQDQFFERL